jgi:hypothetical protein
MINKIILIQLWLGPIPDYFWYHYETTKNLPIDFLFVTDQKIQLKSPNYTVINTDDVSLNTLLKDNFNIDCVITSNRNITTLKPMLGYLFYDKIKDYDYFGYYDIDVLFGEFNKFIKPHLGEYDVISFGNEKHHNRISGPFTIIKNENDNHKIFMSDINIICDKLSNYGVDSYDEHEFYTTLKNNNLKIKILFDICNSDKDSGKVNYSSVWSGDILKFENSEKMFLHFYDKKNTTFDKVGNTIISRYKKTLKDDFYWVTYFTESYEKNVIGLIESIKKYSNRKCILYTINYDSNLKYRLGEQFIVRRLDVEKGDYDRQGRDISVLSSKPIILNDSIDFINEGKFIYVDTDVYLTNVADNLSEYIKELDNYPLMNSHIHDRLLANDIMPNGEWTSTIDILSEETKIPVRVFPRRKANVIIYDSKSKSFFKEQMSIYNQYKNTRPGIFRLHDEDSANILLSKYDFKKSLPLVDMEESSHLNFDKIKNYSYNISAISEHVKLPKNENEIYLFHGFKDETFYKKIENDYGNTVLDCEDIVIEYKENTIFFKKNNFLTDKKIPNKVNFTVKNNDGNIIYRLNNQEIFNYWVFYVSDIVLSNGIYDVEIRGTDNNRIIYKNLISL